MSRKNSRKEITFNSKKPKKESRHAYDKTKPGQVTPLQYPDRYQETSNTFLESKGPSGIPLLPKENLWFDGKDPKSYKAYEMPVSPEIPKTIKVIPVIQECRWFEKGKIRESKNGPLVTSYRFMKVKPSELEDLFDNSINKLRESNPKVYERVHKLREAGTMLDAFDFSANGVSGNGSFLPLPPNDLMVNQYVRDFWIQAAEARWLYNNFGPVKGGISILSAFVVGDGAKFQFVDKESQAIWDEFESRSKIQGKLYQIGCGLFIYGERILHFPEVLVNGQAGFVRLWDRNPADCWEIITDPNNFDNKFAYYFNYPTRWLLQTVDNVPMMRYIIEMVPPEEIVHIKVNSLLDEARGRSQIQAALSDSKQLQDYVNARIIKAYNSAAMVIDHKIEGDASDVQAAAAQEANLIVPGAIVTHNDSESYNILKSDSSNDAKSGLYGELISQIAIALGVPPVYLGGGEGGSRAMALSSTDPATKTFNTLRAILEESFQEIADRVLNVAKKAGRLKATANNEVEIIWPELTSENIESKISMLLQAQANGTLDHQTVSESIAKELDMTNYDYAKTQQIIKQEMNQNPKLQQMFYLPAGKAPATPPGGQTTTSKQQSANQAKSAYDGASMGMSNDNKSQIKQSLEAMAVEIGRLKEALREDGASGKHAGSAKGVAHKAAKTHLANQLRSRTKGTVLSEDEAITSSTSGDLLPIGTKADLLPNMQLVEVDYSELYKKVPESYKQSESAPPGWEDTVVAMKDAPGVDNPYALANWMSDQGYTSHQSEDDAINSAIAMFNQISKDAWDAPPYSESKFESAPPGFPEDLMYKIKDQYPDNDAAAFATAWQIRSNGYA